MKDQNAIELKTTIINSKSIDDSQDDKNNSERVKSLSTATPTNLQKISDIRKLNWFDRVFRKMDTGSMRGVVIMWVRMTLGIGILTLPYYVMQYGAFIGTIVIALAAIINYITYKFIFEASFITDKKNYPDIIETLLGKWVLYIFKATFLLDLISTILICCVVSWDLFKYMLYFFRIGENQWDEWFNDLNTLEFNESSAAITKLRGIFFYSVFLITMPLFLKKNLDSLQKITIGYLVSLFLLLFIILCEVPFFRTGYADEEIGFHLFKLPNYNWIECFFGLCISFYVQPFIFSLRGELLLPSLKRTKKLAKLSVWIEVITFMIVGFFGYYALGDEYTPNLFITRLPYAGKNQISELIFRSAISLFFVLNTLGLAMFNPSLREFLYPYVPIKNEKFKYVVVSLLPFFLICTVAFFYPYIIDITNFFGVSVYNFNGYIIPFMMKIQTLKMRNESSIKIGLTYAALGLFISLGFIGLGLRFSGHITL